MSSVKFVERMKLLFELYPNSLKYINIYEFSKKLFFGICEYWLLWCEKGMVWLYKNIYEIIPKEMIIGALRCDSEYIIKEINGIDKYLGDMNEKYKKAQKDWLSVNV